MKNTDRIVKTFLTQATAPAATLLAPLAVSPRASDRGRAWMLSIE
jgi:hypothetical protein